jgi:hypothetical protein
MKKEYPPLSILRKEFSRHKQIPTQYEEVILKALSHYPELKDVHIRFELKTKHPVPYGTTPAVPSLLRGGKKRVYVVSLLDEADPPIRQVLFKNLPEEGQRAVIGHELGHVVQMMAKSTPALLKFALSYGSVYTRREIERDADLCAIKHGLGFELYVHAVYIRRVPGYVQQRKEIETDYLKPQEILDTLPEGAPAV